MGFIIPSEQNENLSIELRSESFKLHREDTGWGEGHIEIPYDEVGALMELLDHAAKRALEDAGR